jgi:hypothetical protein
MTVFAAGAFTYKMHTMELTQETNLTKTTGKKSKKINNNKHTQTRPFSPTAISKDSFFPRASRTGHVGELNNL